MRNPVYVLIFLASVSVVMPAHAEEDRPLATQQQLDFFESRIRPLLHTKCVKCHGESQQKGQLRLDSVEGLLKGGESGTAVVAGKPSESLMLEAVRYESFEMPPDKPLSAAEIADLELWIANGVAWPEVNGKSLRLEGTAFTQDERSFWSLQPVTRPEPPAQADGWGHNVIDRFIAAKLHKAGIVSADRAEDRALVRRLYFDLLGVPPSPADMVEFARTNTKLEDDRQTDTERWSQLVDQLLSDPRYGEHWGRYWLDIVRYAESDGFRADFYRPEAWRYRDYVVDAFNTDKPYDQFIAEQLAGDEIAPDKAEALVATGYLRTFLYEYNQRDARTQWQDVLNQVTDITGEVFLGIGVGCARCHDHKFDPILQEDYYRLQACFGTMIPRDDIPAADLVDRQQYEQDYAAWLAKGADLREQLKQVRAPYRQKAAKGAIERFPDDIQVIMAKPAAERIPLEGQLADLVDRQIQFDYERAKVSDPDKKRIEELEQQIAALAGKEPAKLPAAVTVADLGAVPQVIHLGANRQRKTVLAGGFSIIDSAPFARQPTKTSTGQRTALARWIASPENPLTARVIVNRVWQRHFGTGLVETASDFGSLGGRPSHPELLDWLASEFVAHNWSIKWLHRQILNSSTYQMSAFHSDPTTAEMVDPGNQLRWRFTIRRLQAEQIRDAMLAASGELRSEQGGPSVEHTSYRRSLYLKALRNTPEPLLRSLDGVDGLNSIAKRSTTTTPTQALNLMNGDWVRKRSLAMAQRVLEESPGTDATDIVSTAFQIALGRSISAAETPIAVQLFADAAEASRAVRSVTTFGSLLEDTGNAVSIGSDVLPPLTTADSNPALAAPFTFAAIIKLNSLYPDASVRTIVSQWDGNNKNRGWAIGVTSEKSAYQPRNLILQVVSETGYEVVPSNLRPELDTPYFAAVVVDEADDGTGKATFYLQPLETKYGKLQTTSVTFKSAAGITGRFPIVLGGRPKQPNHIWDGQLDQVTFYDQALGSAVITALFTERLRSAAILSHSPVAAWDFDNADNALMDVSSHGYHLVPKDVVVRNPLQKAVAELCHVLLNSNEFVYID